MIIVLVSPFYSSPFSGRTERYNHEIDTEDTEDDGEDILFHSFSSCSPRYSKVYSKIEELHQDVSPHKF